MTEFHEHRAVFVRLQVVDRARVRWRVGTAGLGLALLLCAPGLAQDRSQRSYIDPDVQQLLGRECRDAALARILARGEYRGEGTYTEKGEGLEIQNVVLCPQEKGPPLFAVFLYRAKIPGLVIRGQRERENREKTKGHLILVAADGAVIRCPEGNNSVDGMFVDVNDDGIVDRVETVNIVPPGSEEEDRESVVRVLFVLPITEGSTPTLRVALDRIPFDDFHDAGPEKEDPWAWRAVPSTASEPARIEIGPRDPTSGELSRVTGAWKWNDDRRAWVGPGGSPDGDFMRLPPAGYGELTTFARAQRRNEKKRLLEERGK